MVILSFLFIQTVCCWVLGFFFSKVMNASTLLQPYLPNSYLLINLQSNTDSLFQRLRNTKLVQ